MTSFSFRGASARRGAAAVAALSCVLGACGGSSDDAGPTTTLLATGTVGAPATAIVSTAAPVAVVTAAPATGAPATALATGGTAPVETALAGAFHDVVARLTAAGLCENGSVPTGDPNEDLGGERAAQFYTCRPDGHAVQVAQYSSDAAIDDLARTALPLFEEYGVDPSATFVVTPGGGVMIGVDPGEATLVNDLIARISAEFGVAPVSFQQLADR